MRTSPRRAKWKVGAFVAAAIAALVAACGNSAPNVANGGGPADASLVACYPGAPEPGCPCATNGATAACGEVKGTNGGYVTCAQGTTTCIAGTWGPCSAEHMMMKSLAPLGGKGSSTGTRHPESLGMSSDGGAAGDAGQTQCPYPQYLCDPSCQGFIDNSNGVDGGPGLVPVDGGWTLSGNGPTNGCYVPQDWTAYYAKFPSGFDQANGPLPTTCTSGPPDNCDYDLSCNGGQCASRSAGQSGDCSGADFTVGMPCWNGTHFTFEVCNRGTQIANSGILPVGHYTGSPSANPATCNISMNGPSGECDINLANTPLAPGQCLQITPTTDPRCSGVANDSGDQFYWVNFHGTTNTPVLPECDTCNNLTETKDTAASVPGAACAPVACSGQCFVNLTGTVYDPASLEPVYNAVVAIPYTGTPTGSGLPPTIPTGVPKTDSCGGSGFGALRTAYTDVNGNFTLAGVPVQPTVTLVVQIGQWRRTVQVDTSACSCGATINISQPASNSCVSVPGLAAGTIPTCVGLNNYAGAANCLTRLPRTQSGGIGANNIPKIAVTTGACDPEECLLYRMGVASSEYTDETGTGRVNVFYGHGAGLSGGKNHTLPYLEGFNSGLQDGGFETSGANNSFSGWYLGSNVSNGWLGTGSGGAYQGTYWAALGPGWWGYGQTGFDYLSQTFTAPPGATALTYHYYPECYGGSEYFQAQLVDLTAGTTSSSAQVCQNGVGWQSGTLSLTAGHAYTINFINHDDGGGSGTAIDGVSINAANNTPPNLLNNYDLAMLPCDCGLEYNVAWGTNVDEPGRSNLVSYANAGGRIFSSHWGREWIERVGTTLTSGPFPGVANWYGSSWGGQIGTYSNAAGDFGAGSCNPGGYVGNTWYNGAGCSTTGYFDTASARSLSFSQWMGVVAGSGAQMTISPARYDVKSLTSSSVRFVYGRSDGSGSSNPDEDFDFTFDTPLGGTALGRAMYTDMHLATGNLNPQGNAGPEGQGIGTYTFPSECPAQGTALSQQELAAEYLLFDLGSCVSGQPVPGNYPPVTTTGNGTNAGCSGGSDIGVGSCMTDADCQEDFHCANGTCVWSGGSGFYDPNCVTSNGSPGVDLTVGVPCGASVPAYNCGGTSYTTGYQIPICNRGGGTLAAGTVIDLENDGNGGFGAWNCSTTSPPAVSAGSATCSYTLPSALGPGECVDIDTTTPAGKSCCVLEVGHRDIYVNWDKKIPECGTGFSGTGPGCMNNSTNTKTTGTGCPAVCGGGTSYQAATFTRDFQGVCPAGFRVVWKWFSWSGVTPSDSNLDFQAWTADSQAQLGVQYPMSATLEQPQPDNHANGYTDNTVYGCQTCTDPTYVDVRLAAAGYPTSGNNPSPPPASFASHSWLRVNMILNPSSDGAYAPTLLTWNQEYDCVPSE